MMRHNGGVVWAFPWLFFVFHVSLDLPEFQISSGFILCFVSLVGHLHHSDLHTSTSPTESGRLGLSLPYMHTEALPG